VTEADFAKLSAFGMNAARLPIGCDVSPPGFGMSLLDFLWGSETTLGMHVFNEQA